MAYHGLVVLEADAPARPTRAAGRIWSTSRWYWVAAIAILALTLFLRLWRLDLIQFRDDQGALLRLAEDIGARDIQVFSDSQLVASQVLGEYQTKSDNLIEYLNLVKEKLKNFDRTEIKHVPREQNTRADILSKLASTSKKGGNKSVIQETLARPSIENP